IETPHFRLGVSLPKWKVPAHPKEMRNRIREELAELATRLPKVKPKAKELDPWLRAHIYALRLEKLYADFLELVGKTDDAFPTADAPQPPGTDSLGRGPYLGAKSKFQVMILTKEADCQRFLTTFTGADGSGPSRWYLAEPDAFVFATAIKFTDGAYEDDTALYCHLAFNIVHNLVDAYRGYYYRPTAWWQEGYAHWVRRKISDEFNTFSEIADSSERVFRYQDWERRVSALIKQDLERPMSDLAVRFDLKGMKFFDHLGMWSRVDFLMDRDSAAFGKFITAVKGCVTTQGTAAPQDYQLQVQERALKECFELDLETFDAAWKAWAKKAYKGK
ncbi:MAG: hypothetical protein KDB80_15440, partial [Planctomycetes bacterium]|nr:hypothetical protein [Planctomycetota bacterium]